MSESVKSFVYDEFENDEIKFDKNIVINVNCSSFCQNVLKETFLNKERCDVILVAGIDSECVPAHRCILASANEYFSLMFGVDMKEKTQKKIEIKYINGKTLKALVNYCYSGQIDITSENVLDIVQSASLMRFEHIETECEEFFKEQLTQNRNLWLLIYGMAEKFLFHDLMDLIIRIICKDFRSIMKTMNFCQMGYTLLKRILSSNEIYNVTEEIIFEAAMTWVKFNSVEREPLIPEILKLLRITEIEASYLVKNVIPSCLSSDCSELLSKALQWHVLPDSERAELLPIEQTIKRTWPFKILVIGGTEHTNEVKMEYYCFRSKNWEEMGDVQLSDEKIERNFVFLNENIYMMSGCERELGPMVASQSICRFSQRNLRLTNLAPMTTKRAHHSVASVNGFLYAMGGLNNFGVYSNTMERYDPNLNEWISRASMSNMRAHFGVAVLEDYLYVVGGFNSNGYLELVERYNTVNNVWSAVNPMNAKRANAGIGILNGKIYAVGGQNNIGDDLQSVEFYDPATTKWTMVASLITPRSGIAVAVYENELFAIGGATGSIRSDLVERYTEEENKWKEGEPLNYARFKCGVTISK